MLITCPNIALQAWALKCCSILLFTLTLLFVQAVATQEAATQTNNQAQSNEYQLKTLTLWLLKVCYTTRGMPSAYCLHVNQRAATVSLQTQYKA